MKIKAGKHSAALTHKGQCLSIVYDNMMLSYLFVNIPSGQLPEYYVESDGESPMVNSPFGYSCGVIVGSDLGADSFWVPTVRCDLIPGTYEAVSSGYKATVDVSETVSYVFHFKDAVKGTVSDVLQVSADGSVVSKLLGNPVAMQVVHNVEKSPAQLRLEKIDLPLGTYAAVAGGYQSHVVSDGVNYIFRFADGIRTPIKNDTILVRENGLVQSDVLGVATDVEVTKVVKELPIGVKKFRFWKAERDDVKEAHSHNEIIHNTSVENQLNDMLVKCAISPESIISVSWLPANARDDLGTLYAVVTYRR